MCKLGDIIVVKEFKNEFGEIVKKHSFVVINDSKDYLEGINYDFVANMMCSFHNDKHKKKKLKYKENMLVESKYVYGKNVNSKDGFIKVDQLYFFDKNKIKYEIIARLDNTLFDELMKLINKLYYKHSIKRIITNLEKETIKK